jgi:hypothetical protein
MLLIAAVWHPDQGFDFNYRGASRRTGIWDNPNRFGLMMGVGIVLATGLGIRGLTNSSLQKGTKRTKLIVLLYFAAAVVMGIALLKSYSRGAWVGTIVGLVYLLGVKCKLESEKWHDRENQEGRTHNEEQRRDVRPRLR